MTATTRIRRSERVLSIQSHVAYGYVGGKAAVFPLQCLGYDVDVVNTVNYSNHAGYGRSGGSKTSASELNAIFDGMERNELLKPTRLLTGYIPGAEALSAIEKLAWKLKNRKSDLIYVLDPVMGDAGRLYVAADVIPVYKQMLSLATVITPNWFEVEILTDISLSDLSSLQCALKVLHNRYHVPNVVISSIPLKKWLIDALPSCLRPSVNSEHLLCISSSLQSASDGTTESLVHTQCVPLIPGYFSGVGDLFSALLLAHFHPNTPKETLNPADTPLSVAVTHALAKTHGMLQFTYESSSSLPEEERLPSDDELDNANPLRRTRRMRGRELALVQGQDIIRGIGVDAKAKHMELWESFWKNVI